MYNEEDEQEGVAVRSIGKSKKLPLIFQHGGAQSKRTWESGPDGREGFNTMFV